MKRFLPGFIAILGLLAVVAQAQQDYSAWTHGKSITLNTSASGANISGTVNNFPVLIRLNNTNFDFSQAPNNGASLRFADDNNAPLSYEIERWNAGAQVAEIWVLVPTINGNDASQSIRMYWGNSGAASESNSEAVFNTSNNFQAVWHLGENGNNNAQGYLDATNNNLHGTGVSMTSDSDVPGAVGVGQSFDGAADYIDIPNSASGPLNFSSVTGPYTLSAWVNIDVLNGNHRPIVMKGDNQYGLKVHTSNNMELFRKESGWNFVRAAPAGTGQWIHVVGTYNGTLQNLYLNGILRNDSTDATDTGDPVQSFNVNLGRNSGVTTRFWDGILDEVRLSNVARSADWAKLSYENQRPSGQTFAVVDASRPPVDLNYSQGEVLQYTVGQAITNNTISYKGNQATSFSISPQLPEGLEFNTTTGTISGTPTTATPAATYTVTVNNSDGSDNITLNITVVGAPANLSYSQGDSVVYVLGQAITPNQLTFENGPATITISPNDLAGLLFNSSNGEITGTPQSRLPPTDFTVTVTNSVGSANIVINIEVLEAPSIEGYSQELDHTYLVGEAITTNVLNTSGGTPDNITISPSIAPLGLTFNSSTGNISGTPTASSPDQVYTVIVSNGAGSDTITLNIEVLSPIRDVSYSLGTTRSHVVGVPVNNQLDFTGDPLTSTSVSPDLPAGLSLNASGDIVGTPTAVTPEANYTVTLTNAAGSVEVVFTIDITSTATEPSNVSYTGGPAFIWSEGETVNTGPINFDGTNDASVQVTLSASSPALPAGLTLDASSGAITGVPTQGTGGPQSYTIIVSNSGGQDSVTIEIVVGVQPPSNLQYSNGKNRISYLVGQPIAPNELTWDGGQIITAQVTTPVGVLPGGLVLDTATGTISGTPTTVTPPRDYTITITNAGGSETIILNMEVVDAGNATPPSGLVYELGNTMQFVIGRQVVPNPLIYSGTEATSISITPALPTGLQIDGLTGTISGTPTAESPMTVYTVTVVNAADQAELNVNLAVVAADIAPSNPQYSEGTDLDYIINVPITPNKLFFTGTQATSFSITPDLPEGLHFDNRSGTISGTPTAVSLKQNYQVTITNPASPLNFDIVLGVTQERSSLVATVSKPQSGSTLGNPLVSYTLSGTVQSGTVSWTNGIDALGNPVPDANNNQVATLTGSALESGAHENVALTGLNLMPGASYTVTFEFVDTEGAALQTRTVSRVRISLPLSGLRISPSNQNISLEQSLSLKAEGLEERTPGETTPVDVSPVVWSSVDGRGNIDNGSFTPLALGVTRIAAQFETLADTATFNVTSATVNLPAGGDSTVRVGLTIEMVLPSLPNLVQPTLGIAQVATTAIPQGLLVAGPSIAMDPLEFEQAVTYRLLVDSTITGTPNVYRKGTDGWELIPSTREGNWLVISLAETGTLVVAVDTSPPTISLSNFSSPRTATQREGMNLSFAASDNIINPTVTLVINSAGLETRTPMDFNGNGQQTPYNITGDNVGRLGLFYYVEISDGTNISRTDTVDVLVTITDSLFNPNTLALNAYDMFSIPMKPKVTTVSEITSKSGWPASASGVEWRIFGWENNAYAEKTETSQLAPGAAYFVRTNNFNPTLNFAPESMESLPLSSPYSIALSTNWNVFGNPFLFPVDLASVQAVNTELTWFYVFENQTFRPLLREEAIEPWKGYLVWNGTPAKREALSIPGIISGSSLSKLPVQQVAGLTLESRSGKDGYLQFGVSGGLDGHPKPDLVPGGPKVWLLGDQGKVMTDYRPEWREGQRFSIGLSYNPDHEPRLVFHDLYRLGDEVGVRLVSKQTGEVYEVEDGIVALSGPQESGMEMLVGPSGYLEAETQKVLLEKRTLFLGQNAPNPFRTGTSIRYQVPGTAGQWQNVRLEIFDLQGRRVKSLADGRALPGEYRAQWDGTDSRGSLLPTGTYFYRLSIEGERQLQKKLILLK